MLKISSVALAALCSFASLAHADGIVFNLFGQHGPSEDNTAAIEKFVGKHPGFYGCSDLEIRQTSKIPADFQLCTSALNIGEESDAAACVPFISRGITGKTALPKSFGKNKFAKEAGWSEASYFMNTKEYVSHYRMSTMSDKKTKVKYHVNIRLTTDREGLRGVKVWFDNTAVPGINGFDLDCTRNN